MIRIPLKQFFLSCSIILSIFCGRDVAAVDATPEMNRTHIPVADERMPATEVIDPKKAPMIKPPTVTAPKGAPNVVVVLLDDLGFGGPATFGGPINMPVLDRLAQNGLRYNRFHTIGLCAPSRNSNRIPRKHKPRSK